MNMTYQQPTDREILQACRILTEYLSTHPETLPRFVHVAAAKIVGHTIIELAGPGWSEWARAEVAAAFIEMGSDDSAAQP